MNRSVITLMTIILALVTETIGSQEIAGSSTKLDPLAMRAELLENYAKGNFVKADIAQTGKHALVLSVDPAFDCSDILEFICACTHFPYSKIIMITCLWHPEEKAKVVQTVADILKRTGATIDIVIGTGILHGEEADFLKQYPAWPIPNFGDPVQKNPPLPETYTDESLGEFAKGYPGIYGEQLKAFAPYLSTTDHPRPDNIDEYVLNSLACLGDDFVVDMMTTGPTSDVAKMLENNELVSHVRSIASMGGTFGTFLKGTRLGYNFAIDPESTKRMITRIRELNIPTMVVTSEVCSQLQLDPKDFEALIAASNKTPLGEMVCNSWKTWQTHFMAKQKRRLPDKVANKDYNLADLLTFFLSQIPGDHILSTYRGYHEIYPEKTKEGITMLSPGADQLFKTVEDPNSPIFYVDKLKDPGEVYGFLMGLIRSKFLYKAA